MNKKKKTPRNIGKLVGTYHAIQRYMAENKGFPSYEDLVKAGIASSTSVVGYYFKQMHELKMMEWTRRIARSSKLLPLDQADPIVLEYLKTEKKHD